MTVLAFLVSSSTSPGALRRPFGPLEDTPDAAVGPSSGWQVCFQPLRYWGRTFRFNHLPLTSDPSEQTHRIQKQ